MKKHLFTFALLAMIFCFSSCSDDDEDSAEVDATQLIGTWIKTCDEAYDKDWEIIDLEIYDPDNPTVDCEKEIITLDGGGYHVQQFYLNSSYQWEYLGEFNFMLQGKKMIPIDGEPLEDEYLELEKLTSDTMVTLYHGWLDGKEVYNRMTYKRM